MLATAWFSIACGRLRFDRGETTFPKEEPCPRVRFPPPSCNVRRGQGSSSPQKIMGQRLTYDPRRLQGVTLYRETERAFSEGDRVQVTAPNRDQHVANREMGTIEKIDASA